MITDFGVVVMFSGLLRRILENLKIHFFEYRLSNPWRSAQLSLRLMSDAGGSRSHRTVWYDKWDASDVDLAMAEAAEGRLCRSGVLPMLKGPAAGGA